VVYHEYASGANDAEDDSTLAGTPPANLQCLPPSSFIFWHVMKTGGLAVDDLIECACKEQSCGIWHRDGSNDMKGEPSCFQWPSVLTTHTNPTSFDKFAGAQIRAKQPQLRVTSWANASNITILRHPADRIWSLYGYGRQKGYRPFLADSLQTIIANPREDYGDEYEAKVSGEFSMQQFELYNWMTRKFGSLQNECGGPVFGEPRCNQYHVEQVPLAGERWLKRAIAYLETLDYIGFTDDMSDVRDSIAQAWPRLLPQTSECELGVENPTDYILTNMSHAPDAAAYEAIMSANAYDVKLYEAAKRIVAEKRERRRKQQSNTR